jgi:hypothetical protein
MKRNRSPLNSIYNLPADMAVRILCLVGLASAAMVPPLLLTGGFTHEPRLILYGMLCFAFSALSLTWMKVTGRLDKVSDAFDESIDTADTGTDTLDSLQRRLDALEEKRGDASFDPWTALDLRRKIAKRRHDSSGYKDEPDHME